MSAGESRWEKPTKAAVQATDKRPQATAGQGTGTDDAPASLLEGHFDESANRRAFLEALYEWRNDTQDHQAIPLASDSGHPRATAEGGEKPLEVPAPREALAPGRKAAPTPGNNLALKNAAKHQDEQRKTKMVVRKPLSRLAQGGSDGGPQEGGKPKSYGGCTRGRMPVVLAQVTPDRRLRRQWRTG